jgi:predicted component of type VI protein secretion system
MIKEKQMAKSKSAVVQSPNVVKLAEARTQLKEVRGVVKSLTERTKYLARLVKDERASIKATRLTKMETRKAETIAKLKAKLAALEAA